MRFQCMVVNCKHALFIAHAHSVTVKLPFSSTMHFVAINTIHIRLYTEQEVSLCGHFSFPFAHACVSCIMVPFRLDGLCGFTCISTISVLICVSPGDTCPAALL